MNQAVNQVTTFILHSRPYQESSLILQLFSRQIGRFSVMAKGVKGKRSQARKAMLRPFQEIQLEFAGKSDLKTLTHCEMSSPASHLLQDKSLICAYYASELITRAIPEHVEFAGLYNDYRQFLESLTDCREFPPVLRRFEIALLRAVGVAPDCRFDTDNCPIEPDLRYNLVVDSGFVPVRALKESSNNISEPPAFWVKEAPGTLFSGRAILALDHGLLLKEDWPACQRICQLLLRPVIGDKPLQSRKLWHHTHFNQSLLNPVQPNPIQETSE